MVMFLIHKRVIPLSHLVCIRIELLKRENIQMKSNSLAFTFPYCMFSVTVLCIKLMYGMPQIKNASRN
jgi:hypothetical protein